MRRYLNFCSRWNKLETLTHGIRFEVQLAAVKERLEAAKAGSTRGLNSPTGGMGGFSFASAGSRIAKPLRGGGEAPSSNPTIQNLQETSNKRTSWFFQKN